MHDNQVDNRFLMIWLLDKKQTLIIVYNACEQVSFTDQCTIIFLLNEYIFTNENIHLSVLGYVAAAKPLRSPANNTSLQQHVDACVSNNKEVNCIK